MIKKISLIIIVLVSTFISCSTNESKENLDKNVLSIKTLTNIHNSISQSFKNNPLKNKTFNKTNIIQKRSNDQPIGNEEEVNPEMLSIQDQFTDSVFDTNYNYVQSNGLENLFIQYGLNEEIINMADWALQNINDENLYENLQTTFSISNEQDAYFLFYYIELYKEFDINQSFLSGCARAVIGTILVTAVFAGVTVASGGFGAAAAGGFLISKGWSIYNVIAACSQVQEDYYVPLVRIPTQLDINDPFYLGATIPQL